MARPSLVPQNQANSNDGAWQMQIWPPSCKSSENNQQLVARWKHWKLLKLRDGFSGFMFANLLLPECLTVSTSYISSTHCCPMNKHSIPVPQPIHIQYSGFLPKSPDLASILHPKILIALETRQPLVISTCSVCCRGEEMFFWCPSVCRLKPWHRTTARVGIDLVAVVFLAGTVHLKYNQIDAAAAPCSQSTWTGQDGWNWMKQKAKDLRGFLYLFMPLYISLCLCVIWWKETSPSLLFFFTISSQWLDRTW